LLEISQKQQELTQIEDVLRQEERQNKLLAEQQKDEIETARRKAEAEAQSVRQVSQEEAVAGGKMLEVKRQELEMAAQVEQPERAASVALPPLPPLIGLMTPRHEEQDNDEDQAEGTGMPASAQGSPRHRGKN
jgi:hypothetical protein